MLPSLYWLLHLNCVFMLNWIVWNRTVLTFKLRTNTKLKCSERELFWRRNCVLILNWIIWNKTVFTLNSVYSPVGWCCRIHRLHLCRGVRLPNECPRYDIKQSNGEGLVMQGFWEMRSNTLLPLLPGPLSPGMVAPLSMG